MSDLWHIFQSNTFGRVEYKTGLLGRIHLLLWLCYRLDGVENKVQEINAEHEAARLSAKKSKADFELIKKKRYHL